jgi:trk system potassium uptake protein TrkH
LFAGGRDADSRDAAARGGLSAYSRIALVATAVLILAGAAGLLLVEPPPGGPGVSLGRHPIGGDAGSGRVSDWQNMTQRERAPKALFESISARTAGFSAVDTVEFSDSGKLWLCGLMLAGGGHGATAGGMGVVTLAVLLCAAWRCVRSRRDDGDAGAPACDANNLAAGELLGRAVAIAVFYVALVGVVTLLVSMAMRPGYSFINLMFEACSACSNSGLSAGMTSGLTEPAKFALIGGMFVGRVGAVSILLRGSDRRSTR